MYWTLELASKLEDAPWPATKEELIDYAVRSGAPLEVLENLQEIEDDGDIYESIEDIWPDYPSKDDFFFNEEEYSSDSPYRSGAIPLGLSRRFPFRPLTGPPFRHALRRPRRCDDRPLHDRFRPRPPARSLPSNRIDPPDLVPSGLHQEMLPARGAVDADEPHRVAATQRGEERILPEQKSHAVGRRIGAPQHAPQAEQPPVSAIPARKKGVPDRSKRRGQRCQKVDCVLASHGTRRPTERPPPSRSSPA